MHIYKDSDELRAWRCEDKCMMQLIHKCTRCKDWVYEDLSYPEDFDDALGITFYYGHSHCMEEKAREMKVKRNR